MVFGLAAPAMDILIKNAGVAALQVRDDEAWVEPVRAGLDAGDDLLDAALAFGAVEALLRDVPVIVEIGGAALLALSL